MKQEMRFCTSADGTQLGYATYGEPTAMPLIQINTWLASEELTRSEPALSVLIAVGSAPAAKSTICKSRSKVARLSRRPARSVVTR